MFESMYFLARDSDWPCTTIQQKLLPIIKGAAGAFSPFNVDGGGSWA